MTSYFDLTGKVAPGDRRQPRPGLPDGARPSPPTVPTSSSPAASWKPARRSRPRCGRWDARPHTHACNVANWQELDGLVDAAYAAFGKVDILVNNAGSSPLAPSSLETLGAALRPHRVAELQGPVPPDVAGRQPHGGGRWRLDHQYLERRRAAARGRRSRPMPAPRPRSTPSPKPSPSSTGPRCGSTPSRPAASSPTSQGVERGAQAQSDGGAQAQRPAGGDRDGRALSRLEQIELHHRLAGAGRRRNCLMKMIESRRSHGLRCAAARSPRASPSMSSSSISIRPARARCWSRWAAAGSATPTCR